MAIKVQIQPILKVMRGDPKYKKLRATYSTHENFRLPTDTLLSELNDLHRARSIRILDPTDPQFIDKVIEANLKDQATRSRTTEILVRALRAHSLLTRGVESLRFYLLITYSEELRSFRTKEERLQIVNMALQGFEEFLGKALLLKETAQLVATDIDKSAWNLKLVVESLKLHHSPESRI